MKLYVNAARLFCFSVSEQNEAGEVSVSVSRVSTYIHHKVSKLKKKFFLTYNSVKLIKCIFKKRWFYCLVCQLAQTCKLLINCCINSIKPTLLYLISTSLRPLNYQNFANKPVAQNLLHAFCSIVSCIVRITLHHVSFCCEIKKIYKVNVRISLLLKKPSFT